MERSRILLIEDDQALAYEMREFLERHDLTVEIEARGDRAPARIRAMSPDLVILDMMLPGLDGLTICREVREDYLGTILMVTARGEEVDEVLGLELGADDYLAKPVRPRVLLARVRALLRRPQRAPSHAPERIAVGEISVDPPKREARVRDRLVALTSGEFDLLLLLIRCAGQPLPRAKIYQELRGASYDELDRSIDQMISRLRQKLQAASGRDEVIKTVRGVGYLFVPG